MKSDIKNLLARYWRWLFVFLLVFFLFLFIKFSLLYVKVDNSVNKDALVSLNKSQNGDIIKKLRLGLNLIPRGDNDVFVSYKKQQSVVALKTSVFGWNSIQLNMKPNGKVSKVTSNTNLPSCFFGDTSKTYYICLNGRIVKRTAGVIEQNEDVFTNISLVGNPISYKEGVLAFIIDSTTQTTDDALITKLAYITVSGVQVIVEDANYLQDEWGDNISVNNKGESFIINNRNSQNIYIFKNLRDKPKRINYASDVDKNVIKNSIREALDGDNLYLSFTAKHDDKEEGSEDLGDVTLLQYSTSNNRLVKKLATPRNLGSGTEISIFNNFGYSYDDISSKLHLLEINGDKINDLRDINNVDGVINIGGVIYYIKKNGIYANDPSKNSTSYLRAFSKGTFISLDRVSDGILFGLIPNATPSQPAGFVVSTKTNDDNSIKPFDVLPYKLDELPLFNSDYSENTLVFNIKLDSLKFYRDIENPVYDQNEYTSKQQLVKSRLKEDGLSLDKYRVLFSPGP